MDVHPTVTTKCLPPLCGDMREASGRADLLGARPGRPNKRLEAHEVLHLRLRWGACARTFVS